MLCYRGESTIPDFRKFNKASIGTYSDLWIWWCIAIFNFADAKGTFEDTLKIMKIGYIEELKIQEH